MAKAVWNSSELSEFISSLDGISSPAEIRELCGRGLYDMAKEVADEVKRNLGHILTRTGDELDLDSDERRYLPSKAQKQGLIDSFGISAMRLSGHMRYDVKLGFDGYNSVVTRKYTQGQPNALIGRLIESGGTYMAKQPFFRPALISAKARAQKAGEEAIMKELDKKFK